MRLLNDAMVATITKHAQLVGVPSASGISIFNGDIFVVGDDSAYLHQLDSNWQVVHATPLFGTRLKPGIKMPKLFKADLEVLTTIDWNGQLMLLALGSGSKSPERDRGFFYLPDEAEDKIFTLDLKPVYDYLRNNFDVDELNIEGAAADGEYLYLAQRGNLNGKNWLFRYNLKQLIGFGLGHVDTPPLPHAELFHFPQINGIYPGFADLAVLDAGCMVFPLTLENTSNAYDDGEVQGSLLGIMHQQNGHFTQTTVSLTMDGKPLMEKVEGVTLLKRVGDGEYILLAVSDNDDKPSSIFEVRLSL